MNSKKVKATRKRAKELMAQFVVDRVINEELAKGKSQAQLLKIMPHRIHYKNGRSNINGVGTARWFYQRLKKNPEISYEQILSEIYPNEERPDDGPSAEKGSRTQATL